MDLVRSLLLLIEDGETGRAAVTTVEGFSTDQVNYHLQIMHEAGLIEAVVSKEIRQGPPHVRPIRLTWNGHEFLDQARDDARWTTAKSVARAAGGVGLDVLTSLLAELASVAIRRAMGGAP